jgi:predicted AAA+ superfamily ATPase
MINIAKKERYLIAGVNELALRYGKMAFISGPRQCGKTTVTKMLLAERGVGHYYTWDDPAFRRIWAKNPSELIKAFKQAATKPLIIFDEIHKAKQWKRTIKGIYDLLSNPLDILVTGSARLNIYKRGGDSLLGRYFQFRLHPFSLGEVLGRDPLTPADFFSKLISSCDQTEVNSTEPNSTEKDIADQTSAQQHLEDLLMFSGFPEPFLLRDPRFMNAWRLGRVEKIVREDVRDLSNIQELSGVETLVALLPERVASTYNVAQLRDDLQVNYATAKRWMYVLRELYYFFDIKPYQKKVKRSLRKEGKLYLWDYTEVDGIGPRFENLVACHLLKACDYWTDLGYGKYELMFLRDRDKNELDFLITINSKPWLPIEVKTSDENLAPAWKVFLPQLPCDYGLQIVKQPGLARAREIAGKTVFILSADRILQYLP